MTPTSTRSRRTVQVFVWLLTGLFSTLVLLGAGCAPREGANGGSGVEVRVRGQVDMGMEKSGSIR